MTAPQVNPKPKKERGLGLTAALALIFVWNAASLVALVTQREAIQQAFPKFENWMISLQALLSFAAILGVVALWRWKRAGVVALVLCYGARQPASHAAA